MKNQKEILLKKKESGDLEPTEEERMHQDYDQRAYATLDELEAYDAYTRAINESAVAAIKREMGAREEAETAVKSVIDRWLADQDFVTREEFDAVRSMAQKAREENAALSARIEALEKTKS